MLNSLLTGNAPIETNEIHAAVTERFNAIRHTLNEKEGDYIYLGNRCNPVNLGWRFCQNVGGYLGCEDFDPADILAGKYDEGIEATWHDAASAQHWYTYEKEWE